MWSFEYITQPNCIFEWVGNFLNFVSTMHLLFEKRGTDHCSYRTITWQSKLFFKKNSSPERNWINDVYFHKFNWDTNSCNIILLFVEPLFCLCPNCNRRIWEFIIFRSLFMSLRYPNLIKRKLNYKIHFKLI